MISVFNEFRIYNFKIQHQKSQQMQNLAVRILINPLPPSMSGRESIKSDDGDGDEFAYFLINDFCTGYTPARSFSSLSYLFDALYDKRT